MNFSELQEKYPAFIINVPDLTPDRAPESIKKTVEDAGYKNIILFKGVNGKKENEVREALELFGNPSYDYCCTRTNIGCNLSMLKVLKTIVENKIPYTTVFEDDAIFHPEWHRLAPQFYEHTPKDFDIIYMGNQVEECFTPNTVPNNSVPRIHKLSCFCMHAFIITLNGAKRVLSYILGWDYKSDYATKCMGRPATGLTNCDIILKNIQDRILRKEISNNVLRWYCWNSTHNQCIHNKFPLVDRQARNTGIVFQNYEIPSTTIL